MRERETGTLEYEFCIDEDDMTALVFERYERSDAGLQHCKNVAAISKGLLRFATYPVKFGETRARSSAGC